MNSKKEIVKNEIPYFHNPFLSYTGTKWQVMYSDTMKKE